MPIFPTPINLDADYQWAGLHTFEFIATFEGGINTEQISSNGGLTTTLASGGQGQYFFGANPIYLMSATEFRPAEALTAVTLGSATRRWTNFFSVDGNFSGTVTANSFVGDGSLLTNLPAGNPFDQDLNTTDSPSFLAGTFTGAVKSQLYSPENDLLAWQIGWQDTRAGIQWTGNQQNMILESNYGQNLTISDGFNQIGQQTFPRLTDTYPLGIESRRWSNVVSKDGSFTGNLDTEVGGSNRVYNLGSAGDTDTEYLELSASANVFTLEAKKSGAGVVRDFNVKVNDGDFNGNITAENLPTSDPGVPGQFYVTTGGALKVSQ